MPPYAALLMPISPLPCVRGTGGGGRGGREEPPFFLRARDEMIRSCWELPDPEPGLPSCTARGISKLENRLSCG